MIVPCQNKHFPDVHFILQQLWRVIIFLVWVTDCNIYYTSVQFDEAMFERQIWEKKENIVVHFTTFENILVARSNHSAA